MQRFDCSTGHCAQNYACDSCFSRQLSTIGLHAARQVISSTGAVGTWSCATDSITGLVTLSRVGGTDVLTGTTVTFVLDTVLNPSVVGTTGAFSVVIYTDASTSVRTEMGQASGAGITESVTGLTPAGGQGALGVAVTGLTKTWVVSGSNLTANDQVLYDAARACIRTSLHLVSCRG